MRLDSEIDYEYGAKRWMERAKAYIFQDSPKPAWLRHGVDCVLRALLLSLKTNFPFTRDLRVLYNMLPSESRPPVDIDLAMSCGGYGDCGKQFSQADTQTATDMAKQAYRYLITHGVG